MRPYLIGHIKHAILDLLVNLPRCVDEGLAEQERGKRERLTRYVESVTMLSAAAYSKVCHIYMLNTTVQGTYALG